LRKNCPQGLEVIIQLGITGTLVASISKLLQYQTCFFEGCDSEELGPCCAALHMLGVWARSVL